MPQKTALPIVSPWSWQAEEETGIRILYHVIRHAVGKSGPVRIHGLELTRAGDVVLLRAVNTRGHVLPQFIEVPLNAQVLRRIATELVAFATQAEAAMRALHRRRRQTTRRTEDDEDETEDHLTICTSSDEINQLLGSLQERGGASRLAEGSSPEQGSRCTPTTSPFPVPAKRLTHPRKNPVQETIREGGIP